MSATSPSDHHGGGDISGLLWPTINLSILLLLLVFLLKSKLNSHFKTYSVETKEIMDSATIRFKEASLYLEAQKKKLGHWDEEKEKIFKQMQNDVERFRAELTTETQNQLERIQVDLKSKTEAERQSEIKNLFNELTEQVLEGARNSVNNNSSQSKEINSRLVEGVF